MLVHQRVTNREIYELNVFPSVGLDTLTVYVPLINPDVKLDLQNVTEVNLGWVQTNPN